MLYTYAHERSGAAPNFLSRSGRAIVAAYKQHEVDGVIIMRIRLFADPKLTTKEIADDTRVSARFLQLIFAQKGA
jgi:hypothetical protein